jgi:hypothetical protein
MLHSTLPESPDKVDSKHLQRKCKLFLNFATNQNPVLGRGEYQQKVS